jgi:DNA-binding response OmpR family regulator
LTTQLREAHAKNAGQWMRICIVDDNAMVVDALALLLRDRGHEVFSASNTSTALSLIDAAAPDFVVLDVELAGERGDAFASTLRACFPALALVLTSGHAMPAPGSVGLHGADV